MSMSNVQLRTKIWWRHFFKGCNQCRCYVGWGDQSWWRPSRCRWRLLLWHEILQWLVRAHHPHNLPRESESYSQKRGFGVILLPGRLFISLCMSSLDGWSRKYRKELLIEILLYKKKTWSRHLNQNFGEVPNQSSCIVKHLRLVVLLW